MSSTCLLEYSVHSCQIDSAFRPDVVMQFSHVNLVHRYIENRFITERLPIHLADVKSTLLSIIIQTAFNMPKLSENQTIESL